MMSLLILTVLLSRLGVSALQVRSYEYDGWKCRYRYKAGSGPAVMLIHPIGIGLSSWFWEPVMNEFEDAEVFAPDLVGCGESQVWDPSERGLFIPLDYVRQCEELWRREIGRPCVVVAQGGLAPVGVGLATRETETWDGSRAISHLVLCSPPIWNDMANGARREDVSRNYQAWRGPLGQFGYGLLRQKNFVKFFSDLILFSEKADESWLEKCRGEAEQPGKQHPVFAFNAGIVGARGLYDELRDLNQPTLILQGAKDARSREEYLENMPHCHIQSLPDTLNVLPWERPAETARAITNQFR